MDRSPVRERWTRRTYAEGAQRLAALRAVRFNTLALNRFDALDAQLSGDAHWEYLPGTPKKDGFRMPAEFEPHAGTWMLWPERPDVWRRAKDGSIPGQAAFAEVARSIAQYEPVRVGVSEEYYEQARATLVSDALPKTKFEITIVKIEHDDSWARDTGPTFVVNNNGDVRGVDWIFKAYDGPKGPLYPLKYDDGLAKTMMQTEGVQGYRAPLILEGGSIATDGCGTVVVTEPTVLGNKKNQMTRDQAEEDLKEYLGAKTIVWLPSGVEGDETGGHVDVLLLFTGPGEVLLSWPEDGNQPGAKVSREAKKILERAGIKVTKLLEPKLAPISEDEAVGIMSKDGSFPRQAGDPVTSTYANAYVLNGAVLVPQYGDEWLDKAALETFRKAFPGREIIGIPSREIALGGGSIHCILQQVPTGQKVG